MEEDVFTPTSIVFPAHFFKNIRGVSESQSGKQYPGNDFPVFCIVQ